MVRQQKHQPQQPTDTTLTVAEKPKSGVTEKKKQQRLSLDNIKQVDGKYYYVKEDGSYKTNFAVSVNGQLLYFGKDGALTSTSTHLVHTRYN